MSYFQTMVSTLPQSPIAAFCYQQLIVCNINRKIRNVNIFDTLEKATKRETIKKLPLDAVLRLEIWSQSSIWPFLIFFRYNNYKHEILSVVLLGKSKKVSFVLGVACPFDTRIIKREKEKTESYTNLIGEILKCWKK